MVLVRRLRKRNANITVEANAEVLFAPQGDIGVWQRRLSGYVRDAAASYAPTNKRPRWDHYGAPLKETFTASTTYQPGRMRVYSAVGSSAPHAYYVDQGTGIYAGNGPYLAKVIPPYHRGSPSLYESTWHPGGPGQRRVKPVFIKGQKGQGFFAKGLERGFERMRMRSFQLPSEGSITSVLNSVPTGLLNFLGNTESNGAFKASLVEWRSWRDVAFKTKEGLGRGNGVGSKHSERSIAARSAQRDQRAKTRAEKSKIRSKAYRDKQRTLKTDSAKTRVKPKSNRMTPSAKSDVANRIKAELTKQGRQVSGLTVLDNGTWTALVKSPGGSIFKPVTGRWRK